MTAQDQHYWFPAKRYGWGWGFPRTWEGWTVMLGFVALVLLIAVVGQGEVWRIPAIVVATVVFLLICLKKGEPARWRWGARKQ